MIANSYIKKVIMLPCPVQMPKNIKHKYSRNDLLNMTVNKVLMVEVDLWTSDLVRFQDEFEGLNDLKFYEDSLIDSQGDDERHSLVYRNFGGELQFPEQSYWQLKNCWEAI